MSSVEKGDEMTGAELEEFQYHSNDLSWEEPKDGAWSIRSWQTGQASRCCSTRCR